MKTSSRWAGGAAERGDEQPACMRSEADVRQWQHRLRLVFINSALSTRGFGMQEECRGWDVNELVFSAALWGTYQVGRC